MRDGPGGWSSEGVGASSTAGATAPWPRSTDALRVRLTIEVRGGGGRARGEDDGTPADAVQKGGCESGGGPSCDRGPDCRAAEGGCLCRERMGGSSSNEVSVLAAPVPPPPPRASPLARDVCLRAQAGRARRATTPARRRVRPAALACAIPASAQPGERDGLSGRRHVDTTVSSPCRPVSDPLLRTPSPSSGRHLPDKTQAFDLAPL